MKPFTGSSPAVLGAPLHHHGMKKAASQAANKGAAKPPDYIKTGAVLIVAWPRNFSKE